MASLMLSVGDMQVTVAPVPGSLAGAFLNIPLPDDHPLMAGDHVVTFYERIQGNDAVCSAILGEAEALEVVGLWLTLDTERELVIEGNLGVMDEGAILLARARLVALMGDGIELFFP